MINENFWYIVNYEAENDTDSFGYSDPIKAMKKFTSLMSKKNLTRVYIAKEEKLTKDEWAMRGYIAEYEDGELK